MMKNILSRIWLPVAVVSITAARMASVETPRQDFYFDEPDFAPDTIIYKNKFASASANLEDSTFVLMEADTIPKITARDTIKVPDSLRLTDPFRYKYYVALVDSLTHVQVRDSLKAAGDSLDWPKIDSIYVADSVVAAKAAFQAWYNSLDKTERKKYDFEKKVNAKMHVTDSLNKIKTEKREYRDSVREATPRVLQTFAVADSMQYKRIIKWTHTRDFHQMELMDIDTSFNARFNDYPFLKKDVGATWLGVAGSALETFDYFQRDYTEGVAFYAPFESWSPSARTLPQFNSKTPYTELAYWGTLFAPKEKESDNLHILTTQNITPAFNFTLGYDRFGGGGILENETTKNKTVIAAANYLGKKYLMHTGYIYNMVSQKENGGLKDSYWVRDTTVDAREISVNLSNASSMIKKNTVFLDQQYRIPFNFINNLRARKDSTYVPDDNVTTAFIGHSSEFSTYRRIYEDQISSSTSSYYNNYYINSSSSFDSLRVMKLDNKFFIRLQPWSEDGIVSKLNAGIGNKIMKWYDYDNSLLYKPGGTTWNSTYVYAGAEGRMKNYIQWDATGKYTFLGEEINDFDIAANATFSIYPFRRARKSPVSLSGHFETSLTEPDHYQQKLFTNHYKWDNDFNKISTTKVQAKVSIPYWKMSLSGGYALLDNNIYYDTLGIVRQNTKPMSVFNVSANKDFVLLDKIHLENRVLVQKSTNEEVMPLPLFSLNGRYYIELPVKGVDMDEIVLRIQIGANVLYNTKWYASAWNPSIGAFQRQTKEEYGNCPYIDAFVNLQWKRACVFVKMENVGMGWPMDRADYFSAAGHIRTQRVLKFGIFWPFYNQSSSHSHAARGSSSSSSSSRSSSSSSSRPTGSSPRPSAGGVSRVNTR